MYKPLALALAVLLGAGSFAIAQQSQQEQEACMDDAFKFCGNAIPDRERVFLCLAQNRHVISPRCHAMMMPYLPAAPVAGKKPPRRSKNFKKRPVDLSPR